MNLSPNIPMNILDAWTGKIVATQVKGSYEVEVDVHDSAVLILRPEF